MAGALKKVYPRLPVLLLADGLYANQTVFGICRKNDWRFIITFKEGNLKSVWQEIALLLPLHSAQKIDRIREKNPTKGWLKEQVQYINDLDYLKYKLHWVEYKAWYDARELHEYFSHLSDIRMGKDNAWEISCQGRLRWCIENEGFNTQKNSGLNLEHAYSHTCWAAYYFLLQIAHLLLQLVEKGSLLRQLAQEQGKRTARELFGSLKNMAQRLLESLRYWHWPDEAFDRDASGAIQIRWDTS